jgi:hypothetical protein
LNGKSDSSKRVFSANSRVIAARDQISRDLDGEVAILNLSTGMYYGLNSGGAGIWNLLNKSRTVGEIFDALLEEYEVEPARCRDDLMRILGELAEAGLIEVENESSQPVPGSIQE